MQLGALGCCLQPRGWGRKLCGLWERGLQAGGWLWTGDGTSLPNLQDGEILGRGCEAPTTLRVSGMPGGPRALWVA